jgi:hypothetical protein
VLLRPAPIAPWSPTAPAVDAPGPHADWDDGGTRTAAPPVPRGWMLLAPLLLAGALLLSCYP